ncbi:hypothetical protein Tco_0219300, partial [Tanacetum coccineum]
TKSDEAPKPSSSKRVKATAKVGNSGKKKQPALGLETLSDIALIEAEQMKLRLMNGEDFVHPKFSTHDDEARQEEVNKEDSFDPRVQTPSYVKSTDDDNSDEEVQGANTKEEEMVEEANELYKDVNINLEGRDIVMTDAPLSNVQATQETKDTHVIL